MKKSPLENKIYEGGKSFFVFAKNKSECYNCGYCVLSDVNYLKKAEKLFEFRSLNIGTPPKKIHPKLKDIPVSINNSHGDPGLQWEDTLQKLEELEKSGHEGPVGIITKSKITEERAEELESYELNLIVLVSISKLPDNIEPQNYERRLEGIENLVEKGIPRVVYFRPVIPTLNEDEETLKEIMKDIADTGAETLVYSGLMGTESVINLLKRNTGREIPPPEGYDEWQENHKLVSQRIRELVEDHANKNGLEVFRKTSCGVTNALDLEYDYNIHFSKPKKYNCESCVNLDKCTSHASRENINKVKEILEELNMDGEIVHNKKEGECKLKQVCKMPCTSCKNSKGTMIKLKGKHTQGIIGIIRWLTGINVTADEVVISHRIPEKEIENIKKPKTEKKLAKNPFKIL